MPAQAPSAPKPSRSSTLGCAAVLALAALAAYANTFRAPFIFDDTTGIVGNPTIRHLGDLKAVLFPAVGRGLTEGGRPVLNLSLALCYAVSGTRVWSYHALNLLVHILAGLTLFGILRRTLAGPGPGIVESLRRDALPLSFAMALLWTLHPLQTEAVTYVIQRAESLMGLFFLLTLYCFIRSASSPRPRTWRVAAVLACLAAVGTKEVAVAAPVLVFLYDRTFVAGSFREAWRRRRGIHLCLAGTWLPLALLVAGTGWNRGGTAGFDVGVSPWAYGMTQFKALAVYVKLSLWPHPLVIDYGTFWMSAREAAPYALVIVALLAATGVALVRRPPLGYLGAWFFTILAPTSLVPGRIQMIVEHRMYLPLAAVVAGAVLALHAVLHRRWLAVAGAALAVLFGFMTAQRNALYGDDLALWRQTAAESPQSIIAQSSLGMALYVRHRGAEALPHFLAAASLDPDRAANYYNVGLAYAAQGKLPEAAAEYREALRRDPGYASARYQLGLALVQMNRPETALGEFAEAVRLDPAMPEARYEWGVALNKLGRLDEAADQYRAAVRLKPDFFDAQSDLGTALFGLGRIAEAGACFAKAEQLRPDRPEPHFDLGLVLERQGRADPAIAQFAEAVRLKPDYPAAQFNLGVALAREGSTTEAVEHFQALVRLEPASPQAHFFLGQGLLQLDRPGEARQQFEAALEIDPAFAPARSELERLSPAQ